MTEIKDTDLLVIGFAVPGIPLPRVWPLAKEFLDRRGFRIEKDPIQVACFAQAINSGLINF